MNHLKTFLIAIALIIMTFSLASCGSYSNDAKKVGNGDTVGGEDSKDKTPVGNGSLTAESGKENEKTDEASSSKILVAYFSCTNNTKGRAETLQSMLNADIYRIVPAIPYTTADLNYNTDCRANREQNDPTARPEISGKLENLSQYEVVYIGYPIWWSQAPKIIYTFLESYDFDGITIIPFCTSGSSGMGSSATNLHRSASSAIWKSGCRVASNADIETLVNMK